MPAFKNRKNLVLHTGEKFRPPPQSGPATSFASRCVLRLRRFFDLQFGTIWCDLAFVLPTVRGVAVDVGCGAQPFRPMFSQDVKYLPIDIEASLDNFGYRTPDTVYYSGNRLPVEDAAADFMLCTETLEHVLEPAPFLDELFRCLKPGGQAMLTVPFAARWHFIPHDYWRYTPSAVHHLLTKAGFSQAHVYARGNAATVACYKTMGCVLPLVLSAHSSFLIRTLHRLLGLLLCPMFVFAALVANISLYFSGAEDCLGFTILASKPT